MIEESLDEEHLEDFKSLTLTINPEDKSNNDKLIKRDSADKNVDKDSTKTNKNDNYWSANFISPLTSIPNKITTTLWSQQPKPPTPSHDNTTIKQTICITENPNNYFTFRESVLARALIECKQVLDEEADGPLIEAFLLTQISHWNSDKERLLLLTPQTLVICKYDFIALKRLGFKKIALELIDEMIIGDLVYPSGSLIPQMNGFVDGLNNVLETCIFARWSKSNNEQLSNCYQPRNRNMRGVRLLWNKNKPNNFGSYWNPFSEDIPFTTFTFHPLYFHKDSVDDKMKNLYSLEVFVEKLTKALSEMSQNKNILIEEKDIILQSYVGIGSVIYNRNALGFFKVRGKFSF